VNALLDRATLTEAQSARIHTSAVELVEAVRRRQRDANGLDALLGEYDLSSAEGIVLMCLAEALLRIPDSTTADRLIADKLAGADWQAHLGVSDELFVNASTWALLLTGRIVQPNEVAEAPTTFFARLVARIGEPIVRTALRQAMKILGQQFVMGETIDAALARAARAPEFRYSFDMLGEVAVTKVDAQRYFDAYRTAIAAVGDSAPEARAMDDAPSVSVKLSALSPRYEVAHAVRAVDDLAARLRELALVARAAHVSLTVDAEEAERLELSLAVFARVHGEVLLGGWNGLGLAVQAYQKRAPFVLDWLERLARSTARNITLAQDIKKLTCRVDGE
jgi:RHH-type proline utilization regulon transcriptional repressor/proline dehydrogenase/delta 1-pyrroline-5-carboxylate dehydrogenase